jgi:hypothetical protein
MVPYLNNISISISLLQVSALKQLLERVDEEKENYPTNNHSLSLSLSSRSLPSNNC